jgi:hypothetical protein
MAGRLLNPNPWLGLGAVAIARELCHSFGDDLDELLRQSEGKAACAVGHLGGLGGRAKTLVTLSDGAFFGGELLQGT